MQQQERCLRVGSFNTMLLAIILGLFFLLCGVTCLLITVLCNIFYSNDSFHASPQITKHADAAALEEDAIVDLNYTKLHLAAQFQLFSALRGHGAGLKIDRQNRWNLHTSRLSFVGCDSLMEIHNHVASGWTKMVNRAKLRDGRIVALKRLDFDGYDMRHCLAENRSLTDCLSRSTVKFFKELIFLQHLQHPNIIRLLGFCIPQSKYGWHQQHQQHQLFVITELGEPIDLVQLLQKSWDNRLRIFLGLARLLKYLAASPLGSLALKDFRRQQFVLVGGELKLSDLDDLDPFLPSCESYIDCANHLSQKNTSLKLLEFSCEAGHCINYNDNCNLRRAANQFAFIVQHGAPENLHTALSSLLSLFTSKKVSINSDILYQNVVDILQLYSPFGNQARRETKNGNHSISYIKMEDSDLSGLHDYVCSYTMADSICTITTHDEYEAAKICDKDVQCQGFVVAERRSWSGRRIVVLKNGIGPGNFRKNFAFYQKPVMHLNTS